MITIWWLVRSTRGIDFALLYGIIVVDPYKRCHDHVLRDYRFGPEASSRGLCHSHGAILGISHCRHFRLLAGLAT